MTLADLRALVAEYLGQPISDGGALTSAKVNRAVNDAYVRLAEESRCFTRAVEVAAVDGQAEYALPLDMVQPQSVLYANRELAGCTAEQLDVEEPGWRAFTAGAPRYWLRSGAVSVQLAPAPKVGTPVTLCLRGEVTPSDVSGGVPLLVGDTDVPRLPYAYQAAIAFRAVAQLALNSFPDDPVAQASGQAALVQYQELLTRFRASLTVEGAYR